MSSVTTIALLMAGTLASEDLTCITAGRLIGRGEMSWFVGIFGCWVGIYVGDLALWLAGRLGIARLRSVGWIAQRIESRQFEALAGWLDRNAAGAIVASRFLPGLRLPLYLAAGAAGRGAARFALWTLLASLAWTPLVILLIATLGERFTRQLERFLGGGWIALAGGMIACFVALRVFGGLCTDIGRARLTARVSRIWRWEFWPMRVFYLPLVPWIAWLALRHRGLALITAANPRIPLGGFVGESKFQILAQSRSPHILPSALIKAGDALSRHAQLDRAMRSLGLGFPIILKPDIGQRGAGVRLAQTREAALEVLAHTRANDMLAQPFHPGPFEAGVFYYRIPGERCGRILSITEKHFPSVTGDGLASLRQLIWRHGRYRMQADVFLRRHAQDAERVLAPGEILTLTNIGNHCQGALFRDGRRLITPRLQAKIDQIAKTFDGFYFGRFDVRYSDEKKFMAGEDLAIVELNGITSESTNIYDPAGGLLRAYRTLFKQWWILFRIAALNRARGHAPSRFADIVWAAVRHFSRGGGSSAARPGAKPEAAHSADNCPAAAVTACGVFRSSDCTRPSCS